MNRNPLAITLQYDSYLNTIKSVYFEWKLYSWSGRNYLFELSWLKLNIPNAIWRQDILANQEYSWNLNNSQNTKMNTTNVENDSEGMFIVVTYFLWIKK